MQTITPHLVVRWLSPGGKVLMPLDGYPFSDRYGWLEERHGLSRQLMFAGGTPMLCLSARKFTH